MKHKFFTSHLSPFTCILLAAVLIFAACNKEEDVRHERDIVYNVAEQTSTVHLTTDTEFDALLEQFCDYAKSGSSVTFHNALNTHNSKFRNHNSTKNTVTYSTTSREEMKRWMRQMEAEGKTVTVTYDSETSTWNGMAYNNAQPINNMKRLNRVTMDKSCGTGQIGYGCYRPEYYNNYGIHTVHTYTWSGHLLTHVDMEEETILYQSDCLTVDSIIRVRNTATLTYTGNQRTALYLHDDNGNTIKEYRYTYDNQGRLVQEFQTDPASHVHSVDYYYYKEFLGLDWYFVSDYLNFLAGGTRGLDFLYDSIGQWHGFMASDFNIILDDSSSNSDRYTWSNGDLVRVTSPWNILLFTFDYDNSPHPYGVSLGTTSLLPGYNTFVPFRTFWSQHNLTHVYGQTQELRMTYTYNTDGSIATAEMRWTDGSTIHWTFEYMD